MKLLFDAYWLVNGPPSGRTVVREIIQTWTQEFPEDELSLLVRKSDRAIIETLELAKNDAVKVLTTRAPIHALAICGLHIPRHVDAVISQNFTPLMPHRAIKATFLHDGIFRQHPDWFTAKEKLYLSLATLSIRSAGLVLTSTTTESKRIQKYFASTRNKTRAVGLGLPSWVSNKSIEDSTSRVQSKPYILAVGRLNIRKNLNALIHAYELNHEVKSAFNLVIVGEPNGKSEIMGQAVSSVRFMSAVDDLELCKLYEGAAAFVFPSLDEGFGLPLLEAANFDLPTAASDLDVFREIDLAQVYFDPRSVSSISAALTRLMQITDDTDPSAFQERRSRAMEKYNWSTVVRNIRQTLRPKGRS